MFNALALLSFYMVLEPRDSCNYPFFTFCVTVDTEGNRSPNLTFHERRKTGDRGPVIHLRESSARGSLRSTIEI